MNSYKGLSLLVSDTMHAELRKLSFEENLPMSFLVREGIKNVLKKRDAKLLRETEITEKNKGKNNAS